MFKFLISLSTCGLSLHLAADESTFSIESAVSLPLNVSIGDIQVHQVFRAAASESDALDDEDTWWWNDSNGVRSYPEGWQEEGGMGGQ